MIVVAGSMPIKPEMREEAIQAALAMAAATQQEAGCITYRFYSDLAAPNTFFVFEEWASEAHLAAHFQTPHMAEFNKKLPALMADSGEVKKYVVTAAELL